jgi:succinate dehydrogenase / fumarate reductase iron-sulfur subunit
MGKDRDHNFDNVWNYFSNLWIKYSSDKLFGVILMNISIKIWKSVPLKKLKLQVESYSIPIKKGMTVLDALLYIKENLDPSIAFRYSCRMGNCGSCSMIINKIPRLACQTQVNEFEDRDIELQPLENFPVIRDLVSDFTKFYYKHQQIKPYIIKKEKSLHSISEERQTPKELDNYIQFALCIKCGSCLHSCPIYSSDLTFLGPHALSQAYRYLADSRDQGLTERIEVVDNRTGCWGCHFAGSCSETCPKGVDPALGIQLLKRMITAHNIYPE